MISIRIVNVDYYMCYPIRELDANYSEFRGTEVRQVPVIQIYGTTQSGHKTCVNIHRVLPYVYIPYDGTEASETLSYKIAAELDKALNISLGQASANTCHIHNIVLVSGLPLYGYHERQHQFFKIYFYNPAIIKKACSLLENGAVLGKCFQPHESHINYILQFMMDHNLHGMSFVNISRVMYRINPEDPDLLCDIPPDLILPNNIQPRTVCKFEMDAQAASITNRDEISTGQLAVNPGIAALWEDEKQRRRDKQMDSQISFSLTQDRNEIKSTSTQIFFENKLSEILSRASLQSDDSSSDLNRSVYPAETPDDSELINASTADHTILDNTTLLDETIQESQTSHWDENDDKLLQVLLELKERANVEKDSALSQEVPQEEAESSSEDENNYTLSLNNVVADDDSVWENTFWEENCEIPSEIPQLDGVYDSPGNTDSCLSDYYTYSIEDTDSGIYKYHPQIWETRSVETRNNYRNANEVYIDIQSFNIPTDKKLNPGRNKLILTQRISSMIPPRRKIKILSDVCIKCAEDFNKVEQKKSDYEPLCIMDGNCNYEINIDDFVRNEVVLNDVSLGNVTPVSLHSLEDIDIPESFIKSNASSRPQSPTNIDYFDEMFFDEFVSLKEKTPVKPSENNKTKTRKTRKNIKKSLSYDVPNTEAQVVLNEKKSSSPKHETVVKEQRNQYYLRDYLNSSFAEKKCKSCPGCSNVVSPPHPVTKKKLKVPRETGYPLKFPQESYYLDRLCTLKSPDAIELPDSLWNPVNHSNKGTIDDLEENLTLAEYLRSIILSPDSEYSEQISNCTARSPENNNNIFKENQQEKCINVEMNDSTTKKIILQANYSSSDDMELIKSKIKNWNLDGQGDSPSSDSGSSLEEESSKKLPQTKKNSKNTLSELPTKKKPFCRTPGLTKPSVKKVKKTKKSVESKKNSAEAETKIVNSEDQIVNKKESDEMILSNINNSIMAEIKKKDLKVLILPLDLKSLKSYVKEIDKTSETLNAKSVTRYRKKVVKDKLFSSSSTDSSDNELPDKKIKSEKLDKTEAVKISEKPDSVTITSSSAEEQMKTEFLENQIREKKKLSRLRKPIRSDLQQLDNKEDKSQVKMVVCSSSSANDEEMKTTCLENQIIEKRKRGRPRKNKKRGRKYNLTTKKTVDKSVTLQDSNPTNNTELEVNLSLNQYLHNTSVSSNNSLNVSQSSNLINSPNLSNGNSVLRVTRNKSRENKNNYLLSDSSNNSQEKITSNISKTETLEEKSPSAYIISSNSSENTNESSVKICNGEKILETENESEESNEVLTEKKSPQKILKEAQSKLFQNVVVRLERLTNIDLMNITKTGINKNKDSSETLNETEKRNKPSRNGSRTALKRVNSAHLNKSPVRATRNKNNVSLSKYSPLNIIVRSPKKQSSLVQKENNNDYEPLAKRLRTHFNGLELTKLINNKKNEMENQNNFQGTGEFQNIPLNQEELQTDTETLKDINKPILKYCDIKDKNIRKINTPDSIKKRLFNLENNNLNATVYEEFKTCSYEKSTQEFYSSKYTDMDLEADLNYVRRIRQEEENFLNNLTHHEEHTEEVNNKLTDKNTELDLLNNTTEQISTTTSLQNNINSKLNNPNKKIEENIVTIKRKSVKKKDKKPVSPTKFKDFDYVESTPEKDTPGHRETLSQQGEKELFNIDKCNTKMHNLTAAEKYDLKRDFAPQPGTSRVPDEITHISPNISFPSNDISFIDKSFMLNYTQTSKNFSILDSTITDENTSKIWMPKYYPPSRQDIKNSLSDYNIPEHRFQQPFYSKYSDVTRKVDIGHNVLKIPSTTTADLDEFESSNDFCGIEKWRKEKFSSLYPGVELCKNFRTTVAGHSKIIMIPAKLPPTRDEIMSWLKTKIHESEEKTVNKIEKPRIIIPSSPGNSNDSFNESMTLSPCTPELNSPPLTQNVIESSQSTPLSSQESTTIFKREKFNKRGNLQRKVLFSQSMQKSQEDDNKHLKLLNLTENQSSNDSCQITGVTLNNTHGFQMSFENLQNAKALSEHKYLTILVIELHIRTRGDMYPDPQYDSVRAIFYSILNDVPEDFYLPRNETGVIVVDTLPGSPVKQQRPILEGTGINCKINYVKSEIELIDAFVKLIRKWDPDIFVGFEIEMLSWGYIIERCNAIGINLPVQISRINPDILKTKHNDNKKSENEELKLNGRIILDGWRLFRHEIALQSYTFENLMYHILHQRVPAHSFKDLSFWWEYRSNYFRHITANYYITRVEGVLKLLDQLDLIGRTSELAKLFGIQFFEVLSRGTQFRVESMMLRLAKPLNYIPVSPSIQQRAKMRAPEFVPLILEPESRFYTDPLIVLDFQSLYPSIIIAYNYCFSTCIGRVEKLGTNLPFDFGACQLKISRSRVKNLQDKINFSPCGVGFVKQEVRQGILPRMLKEILETRLMVKSSMKENKENKLLQRVLHSRQLGLKLIANVTYGYTSANFSGRMPCIEVGDSVVSKGRETLERAIKTIEQTERWRARVVYGDTDSLFVLVPGRSREEAFKIGAEIAEAVTNDNPPPVKLKLEKVYHPSLLQTKKRYVGYMYESPDQKEPEYNAKGIETVRRDGCPAVAKMLEKTLRLLFDTRDMSLVKRYVCRQFEKLLTGRASIQDLVFAREYRGVGGYRPGACVPALELARRWTATDKRREPRRGERVPYIVVHGPPGLPIIRLVRSPKELLNQDQNLSLRPNAVYYITRVIAPPLNRCLSLIGADVQVWYNEMPRKQLQILPTNIHFENSKKSTISQYFATMSCVVCNNQTRDGLCEDCCNNSQQTVFVLQEKLCQWEQSFDDVKQICQSCCGRGEYTDCVSLDCPVLYRLNQIKRDLKQVPFVRNLISKL